MNKKVAFCLLSILYCINTALATRFEWPGGGEFKSDDKLDPDEIKKTVEKLGEDTMSSVQKAGGDTLITLQKAGGDTVSTLQKAGDDSIQTVVKAGNDVIATYTKAWKDTDEQAKASFKDAVDAGKAAINFTNNQLNIQREMIENADKRLREGKVVDAMWGLAIEPLQGTEENFSKATQESSVIASAAASAAATYGGPAGAAAYAAWSTYKATGDADMALRVGLLAAATAHGGTSVSSMPAGTSGDILKKSAMAGIAGGIAVAAAGGDEQAIKDGFLKSGGAVLIQAGNDKAKAYSPKAKDAWDTVQCVTARDVDCLSNTTWARDAKGKILYDSNGKPRIDTAKLDPAQNIGKWTGIDPNSTEGKKNEIITKISQLPKMEVIPLMKNNWVLTWSLGKKTEIEYGSPTVVLTHVGADAPFISKVEYERSGGKRSKGVVSGNIKAQGVNYYTCSLAGINRTVKVRTKGNGCEAIYRREDGIQDVVWHSDHFPKICTSKAAEFIKNLRSKGIICKK